MRRGRGPRPPTVLRWILGRVLHPADRRFAISDLDEEFAERAESKGAFRARWWYRRQVIASLVPAARGRLVERRREAALVPAPGGALTNLRGDLRLGVRMLIKSPLASTLTVVSLGIGIAGVTVVVAAANTILFEAPVGLADPQEVVSIYRTSSEGHAYGGVAYADMLDIAREVDAVSDVAAVSTRTGSISTEDWAPVAAFLEVVTPNYFEVLGTRAVRGRVFTAEELSSGGDTRLVVLGHHIWRTAFEGRNDVVGTTVRVGDTPYTVVGVAPEGMRSRRVPMEVDAWIPLGSAQSSGTIAPALLTDRDLRTMTVLARLAPGAGLESVQAQASVLADRLVREDPETWGTSAGGQPQTLTAVSERGSRTHPRARVLYVAAGALFLVVAGLVLLLACANVAGLFVARAHRRRAEMAVRASLGASRSRIVCMLLMEGLWPGLLGAALGIALASWAVRLLAGLTLPVQLPVRFDFALTPVVLGATLFVALLATLAFSLLPALGASRTDLVTALKERQGGSRGRFWSLRGTLVMVQCATSAVLVIGAMLFVRTLSVATEVDIGFDPDGVATVTHRIPQDWTDEASTQALAALRERLAAQPGIDEVVMASGLELTLFQAFSEPEPVEVDGYAPPGGTPEQVHHNAVTPGFHELLSVPILAGRSLRDTDRADAAGVAVINETFAHRFWPGRDPLGRSFRIGTGDDARTVEVVGVARDGKYFDFDDPPQPYYWVPLDQAPQPHVAVLVKGSGPAHEHLATLRREVIPVDGNVQMVPPSVLWDQVSIQFIHLRILSRLLGWGGLFGLLLAAIGIYGVVAFAVTERSREMAIRTAMGAERGEVVRSIALDGLRLAGVGLAAGVLFVIPAASLVRSILHDVSPTDPQAIGLSLAVLLGVAALASILPARRITKVDPMVTLRAE